MATGGRTKYDPTKMMPGPSRTAQMDDSTSSFVTGRIEDDTPIFNKQKVEFRPKAAITHMCASNGVLILATAVNSLQRICIDPKQTIEELEIPNVAASAGNKIRQIFLDPSGRHLIISMFSDDVYYISRNIKQARPLARLRGNTITAVGWNKSEATDSSTGAILVGTKKGILLETQLSASETQGKLFAQSSTDAYIRQMMVFDQESVEPVMGIEVERISSSKAENKCFILVVLPRRLYQFVGTMSVGGEFVFTSVFRQYDTMPARFQEIPSNLNYSALKLFYSDPQKLPDTFAWMLGEGVFYGKIDAGLVAGQDVVTFATKLIPYPTDDESSAAKLINIVLTQYHVLVLFPDRIKVLSVLNDQLVFTDFYPEAKYGKMQNICRDPVKGSIWAFSSEMVFKYKVVKEDRDVWQIYLDQGNYEQAIRYCQYPEQKARVKYVAAETAFDKKKFMESAKLFAQTDVSFEKIALKFAMLEEKEPLKAFLKEKLHLYRDNIKEGAQITMLVMWIVELYLSQLTQLKYQQSSSSQSTNRAAELRQSLREFLDDPKVKKCCELQKGLVYELLGSHGDTEDLLYFAKLVGDHEKVVSHYIQQEDFRSALEKLSQQNNVELVYKFSPVLMQHLPKETVDLWTGRRMNIDPKKLIPALVQYNGQRTGTGTNEAIRYLEYCVRDLRDHSDSIHNYLIALYAQYDPDKLMAYLESQSEAYYDQKYALRLCSERGLTGPCVHIYSLMGLYEEAVDLALQLPKDGATLSEASVELAKEQASKAEGDDMLRKKLWLKIARYVVETEKDMKKATELLSECSLLKIEDILPFFPDFITIDDFKAAICDSLAEYSKHIEELKDEMNDATKSADQIKQEIQAYKNRHSVVRSDERCSRCDQSVFTSPFYTFSCQHHFHQDCLLAEVLPLLGTQTRLRVEEIRRKLKERPSPTGAQNKTLPALREELDNIVACDCVLCGDIAIRNIDRPFIDETEWELMRNSWL